MLYSIRYFMLPLYTVKYHSHSGLHAITLEYVHCVLRTVHLSTVPISKSQEVIPHVWVSHRVGLGVYCRYTIRAADLSDCIGGWGESHSWDLALLIQQNHKLTQKHSCSHSNFLYKTFSRCYGHGMFPVPGQLKMLACHVVQLPSALNLFRWVSSLCCIFQH